MLSLNSTIFCYFTWLREKKGVFFDLKYRYYNIKLIFAEVESKFKITVKTTYVLNQSNQMNR